MSLIDNIDYSVNVRRIRKTVFGIKSPESIRNESVAHICKHVIKYSEPANTLVDPRLGAIKTDNGTIYNAVTSLGLKQDPGNFGHCELAKPVHNPLFIDYVKKILNIICPTCCHLRFATLDEDSGKGFVTRDIRNKLLHLNSKARFELAQKLAEPITKQEKVCRICGDPFPQIDRKNNRPNQVLGLTGLTGLSVEFKSKKESTGAGGAGAKKGGKKRGTGSGSGTGATESKSTVEMEARSALSEQTEQNKEISETYDIDAEEAYFILKRITDNDSELMGFDPKLSRPDWMMITVLPIPPPTIRPAVQADNGKTSEDDLTHSLNNIIKVNNLLREKLSELELLPNNENAKIEEKQREISIVWNTLQWHVATLIDNETASYSHVVNRAQRPLKTIRQRHHGKSGRIRWNLMGKRVNYSARSVITADPNLSINQVGVPLEVAKILTYPEKVTRYNIEKLNFLVEQGKQGKYPGAKQILTRGTDYRRSIEFFNGQLQLGDTVFRTLMTGDIVLFNRQPSLHKMSMMAHYAIVLDGLSFRLNPNVTPPYNADFDGDEMNLHLPQTSACVVELEQLCLMSRQIVTPNARPIIGLVQDALVGIYRFCNEQTRGIELGKYHLGVKQFMRLVGWLSNYKGSLPVPDDLSNLGWTSRQFLSIMLPPVSVCKDNISVTNGNIEIGNTSGNNPPSFDGSIVGKSAAGGLFHVTWNDMGHEVTRDLIDDASRIMSQWLLIDGFSVGVSDVEISKATYKHVNDIKNKYAEKAKLLIKGLYGNNYTDELRDRIVKTPRGLADTTYKQFEADMLYILGECRSEIEKYTVSRLTGIHRDNRIKSMTVSGSKGSNSNIVQIMTGIGQQDMDGGRIPDSYHRRPLSYVHRDDLTPRSRGFVENSFMSGLHPVEYVYHAMSGRIGTISTSIKTAETGYIQRKLVKVTEDVSIYYDGTVRNSSGNIIQYLYAYDGYAANRIEPQTVDYIGMSDDLFLINYATTLKNLESINATNKEEIDAIEREFKQLSEDRINLRRYYPDRLPAYIWSPVNFRRLINDIKSRFGIMAADTTNTLTPQQVVTDVENMLKSLKLFEGGRIEDYCLTQFKILARAYLCSKKIIFNEMLSDVAFAHLIELVKYKFNQAINPAGEACGIIAAQSIGEPSTQMTLNVFHSTGIGQKANVSRGVPRLAEIISFSSNPKKPSITIYIDRNLMMKGLPIENEGGQSVAELESRLETVETNEEVKALKEQFQANIIKTIKRRIKPQFDYLTFGDIVESTQIVYDPEPASGDAFIDAYMKLQCDTEYEKSNWTLKFVLDGRKMADHNITVVDLEQVLLDRTTDPNFTKCVFSDENTQDNQQIICKIGLIIPEDENISNLIHDQLALFNSLKIKGIEGIQNTTIRVIPREIVMSSTGEIISQYNPRHTHKDKIDGKLPLNERSLLAEEYVIDTGGSNLLEVLNMPYVDVNRTYSNDINDILDIYGIEAARQAIINEIHEVMVYNGANVNIRHIELLADIMTSRGIIQSVDRYGTRKGETGPWAEASFEETTTHMANAAIFGKTDNMEGVSANIMFGQKVKIGTNSFELLVDETKLTSIDESEETEELSQNYNDQFEKIKANITMDTTECDNENLDFQFDYQIN